MAVVPPAAVGAAAPRVSVCIANFNGEAMLADCIASVLAQDTDETIEILVHDDASQDRSLELLRQRYPQVHVLASQENVGFCIANNRMVAAAEGEFILLLNNDAALNADAITHLLAAARLIAEPAVLSLPQYDWDSGTLVDRGCLLDPFNVPTPNLDDGCEDVAYVIGACLWMPRAAWQTLGGFPEWLGSIAEDLFLGCAARLRGWPVRCVRGSGYRHRQGASFGGNRVASSMRTRYYRRYLSERNRLAVFAACTPTPLAWPWLFLHLCWLVLEGLGLSIVKRSRRPWREIYSPALRHAWSLRRLILDTRRTLQSSRSCSLAGYLSAFTLVPRKLALSWRKGMPELD